MKLKFLCGWRPFSQLSFAQSRGAGPRVRMVTSALHPSALGFSLFPEDLPFLVKERADFFKGKHYPGKLLYVAPHQGVILINKFDPNK